MSFFLVLTGYLAAALSLITGAFLGLAILTSPVESERSNGNRPKPKLLNNRQPVEHMIVEPKPSVQAPGQAFRYGPDVNHGRSDMPVSATKQALAQAKAQATAVAPRKRKLPYQERIVRDPGVAMGFAPVPSSGH